MFFKKDDYYKELNYITQYGFKYGRDIVISSNPECNIYPIRNFLKGLYNKNITIDIYI